MPAFDKNDIESKMDKAVDQLNIKFAKIRTGRADVSILDSVHIDYYGASTPINQLATINLEGSRTIVVSPWEKKLLIDIERAITSSDLNLNPSTQSDIIRIHLPALTEETRQEYIKQAKKEAEAIRVSIRNIRRGFVDEIKELKKNGEVSEDEALVDESEIQKITDAYITKINDKLNKKQEELQTI